MRGASVLCLFALGCTPGGVGEPCIPEDEHQTAFAGFDEAEVYVESRSLECATRVCLVNHFRGRVSCPYGQEASALGLPGTDPRRCRVPGASGQDPADVVSVPVPAQLVTRTAAASPERAGVGIKEAVYCSCRCDGPDPSARYCECPDGFVCEKLVDDLGLGSAELAGSYCIRAGTRYYGLSAAECTPSVVNCGNDGKNP